MSQEIASSAAAIDWPRYNPRIRDEQVEMVFSRLPWIALVEAVLLPAVIYGALAGVADAFALTAWLISHGVIVGLQVGIWRLHGRKSADRCASDDGVHLVLVALLAGVYWGTMLATIAMPIGGILYNSYLFVLMASLAAVSLSLLAEYLPAFYAFTVPLSIVPCVRVIGFAQFDYLFLALVGLLSLVALSLFAHLQNKRFRESLALRFTVLDLANELGKKRDAAEHANTAKSRFIAAASHDLRQPLHTLSLLVSALHGHPHTAEVRRIADNIGQATGALEKLFNALLDMSRLDSGVLRPNRKHFDLQCLAGEIADQHTIAAQAKGLNLKMEVTSQAVYSDPLLIEIILRNFLANAVRYTEQGTVTLRCVVAGDLVRLEVRDTGIGIPKSHQATIFDEFFQLANPDRDRNQGLGLGLAIVRRIATLLDHPVGVESEWGQGSLFYVAIPAGDISQVELPGNASEIGKVNLHGLRVLVVDDDLAVRESMRTLLTLWNCRIAIACDEDEAVVVARAELGVPDVVLVDYRLRHYCTGVQAVQRLRREFTDELPALILSGENSAEFLKETAASGITSLHKPAPPSALLAFLRNTHSNLRMRELHSL